MIFALVILLITILSMFILAKKRNFSRKSFYLIIAIITLVLTIGVCVAKPVMHNRFSLNVIDYLIKFNNDGSMTTTQRITTEKFSEVNK